MEKQFEIEKLYETPDDDGIYQVPGINLSRYQGRILPSAQPSVEGINEVDDNENSELACPKCQNNTMVTQDTIPTNLAHIVAFIIFIIGLPFFVFAPYCMGYFNKKIFRCINCGHIF